MTEILGNGESSAGVGRCLQQIRQMILRGELLPGQKVHQGELAEKLNVSRIPVREALSTLQAEGVLVHRPNTGFSVARFSSDDLSEIYLMRRLLETELLRTIDLSEVDVAALEEIDKRLTAISAEDHTDEYQQTNAEFHFALFNHSPLELVRKEVARLWYKSAFYRSLYIFEAASSLNVHEDHQSIIDAVRDNDVEKLIRISDEHRKLTEDLMTRRLGHSRPR